MTRKEINSLRKEARKELAGMSLEEMTQWWKCRHSKKLDEKEKILMGELRAEYKRRTKRELPVSATPRLKAGACSR